MLNKTGQDSFRTQVGNVVSATIYKCVRTDPREVIICNAQVHTLPMKLENGATRTFNNPMHTHREKMYDLQPDYE